LVGTAGSTRYRPEIAAVWLASRRKMATIGANRGASFGWGRSAVIASRGAGWPVAVIAALVLLGPLGAGSEWGGRAPADFEDCADAAEKAASKEAKTAALAQCNAKFAGRRKAGGGYTYYDFMQDRSFDIAGPNPTAQEQKHIDEQY